MVRVSPVDGRARVVAWIVAAVAGLGLPLGPASAHATAQTTISLIVEVASGVDVNTYTGVRMHATVQPSSATGRVTFYVDGAILGTASVVGGAADLGSTVHVGDGVPASAVFEPAPGSGFTGAASSQVTVEVKAVPRVWLVDANGRTVPVRSKIAIGSPYRLMLSGFRFGSLVRVTLGSTVLARPRIGGSGTASVKVTIPAVRPGTAQLTASADGRRASATFVVVRSGSAPSPTPTAASGGNVSVVVPASSPLPSTGGGSGSDGDDDGEPGEGGSLAHTGAQSTALLGWAAVALVLGVFLMLATRTRPRGRHSGIA